LQNLSQEGSIRATTTGTKHTSQIC
jgi:hypothetical protein